MLCTAIRIYNKNYINDNTLNKEGFGMESALKLSGVVLLIYLSGVALSYGTESLESFFPWQLALFLGWLIGVVVFLSYFILKNEKDEG